MQPLQRADGAAPGPPVGGIGHDVDVPAGQGAGVIDLVARHWSDILRVVASIHTGEISAHDVIRILQRDGRPTQLSEAMAAYGGSSRPCTC